MVLTLGKRLHKSRPSKKSVISKSQDTLISPKDKVELVIEVNKVDSLVIKNCEHESFRLFLQYCYNHSLKLETLTVGQVIQLSEMADRFLC